MRSFRSKPVGWQNDHYRHYLASKGIASKIGGRSPNYLAAKYGSAGSNRRYFYTPTYVAGDVPLIAGDAVGTVGAETVSLIPVIVPVALAYGGAELVEKRYKERKKQGKGFFVEKPASDEELRKFGEFVDEEKKKDREFREGIISDAEEVMWSDLRRQRDAGEITKEQYDAELIKMLRAVHDQRKYLVVKGERK